MGFQLAPGAEQLLAVVHALSRARTVAEVQELVRHAARELNHADGAALVLRQGDQGFFADEDAMGPLWKGKRFPLSLGISGWVMLNGKPVAIEDVEDDPRATAEMYQSTFVKSLAMVPIRTPVPIGALANFWGHRHTPTETELWTLQALAESTANALESVGLNTELEARVKDCTDALVMAKRSLDECKKAEVALSKAEHQLRQSQKMEAVGQLAGGIAHDFNNSLTVILSFTTLASSRLKVGDPLRDDLDEIRKAGERAAALTQQLLAFSRQQVLKPRVLELNKVVLGMENMLRRLLGEDIALVMAVPKKVAPIRADIGQLEQVLLNLAINARDAMPRGGKLTIEVADVGPDGEYVRTQLGVEEGDYVMLSVRDTGTGMDPETQQRVFEPFFTTKAKGKGTGLGLSTVYGIIKQSDGHVWVQSEIGKGTAFKVYLPRHAGLPVVSEPRSNEVRKLTGTETVLLVEDDEQVRSVAYGILKASGYNVLVAKNGGEALLTCEQFSGRIHLMLTDVVMPQMSGVQLAERLAPIRPEMKVLCMSGYTDDAVLRHGVLDSGLAFVQKPLTPEGLMLKVRQVLDRG